jgi:4-amino-4-deoxy-L-arabinose transferase-like glycosyltransferase
VTRRRLAAVAGIAASAVFLRCWRLGWALDERLFFPDEIIWFVRVSQFVPLSWSSFDLDFTHTYPTLYGYFAGLATAAAYHLGLLRPAPDGMFDALYVCRVVAVAAGLINVGLVGLLGWRCFSPRAGIAAAALYAVLPLEAAQVHYASVDSLTITWITLALLASHALALRGSVVRALVAGLVVGLAFATKYTGLGALGGLVVPLLVRAQGGKRWAAGLALGVAMVVGLGAGITVGCPPCVLRPSALLTQLLDLQRLTATGDFTNARLVASLGWVGTPYVYQLVVCFPFVLGWPLWLLSLWGIVVAIRRRSLADWVLLVALATYFAAIGASHLVFPRYLMPLGPALVVLAARAGVELADRSPVRWMGLAAVWLYTFAVATSNVAGANLAQQKEVAAWIAARPQALRVATPEHAVEYFFLTPFLTRAGLSPVIVKAGQWLDAPADVLVVPELLAIGARRDHPDGLEARDVARLEAGEGDFREAARWPMEYLHRGLYSWLDPGLSPVLGAIGFRVYVRERR